MTALALLVVPARGVNLVITTPDWWLACRAIQQLRGNQIAMIFREPFIRSIRHLRWVIDQRVWMTNAAPQETLELLRMCRFPTRAHRPVSLIFVAWRAC